MAVVFCERLTSNVAVRTSPGQNDGLVGTRDKMMGMGVLPFSLTATFTMTHITSEPIFCNSFR